MPQRPIVLEHAEHAAASIIDTMTRNSPVRKRVLGLDWWAVLVSLLAALLIKFDVLKGIPW
jgi:hypothetical protein